MAQNQLGIGGIIFPTPKEQREIDMNNALEGFVQQVKDNIDYLLLPAVTSVSAAYTATTLDKLIVVDATSGAVTITLPEAATVPGMVVTVKKIDASGNAVTLDAASSEEIDGATTQTLSAQYDGITVHCDGSEWFIVSNT